MLLSFAINWVALIVAVIAASFIGAIWFSRSIVGNAWLAALGKTPEEIAAGGGSAAAPFVVSILSTAVMAFVLANGLQAMGVAGLGGGALGGLVAGLGYVAASSAGNTAFEQSGWKLWAITSGHHVVVLTVIGAILGAWQ
jgi:hypothetical protein